MSKPGRLPERGEDGKDEAGREVNSGVNLKLIYGLLLLGLLAAIVFAALIVLPFYNRR